MHMFTHSVRETTLLSDLPLTHGCIPHMQVLNTGLTQPGCKVRWDGGPTRTYHSGASVSRGAATRAMHPEPAQLELRAWIKKQGWPTAGLSRYACHARVCRVLCSFLSF